MIVFAREMRGGLPGVSERYVMRPEWVLGAAKREEAAEVTIARGIESWESRY